MATRSAAHANHPCTALTHMLCWNPGTDQVALVKWPDKVNASGPYRMSCLACYMDLHKLSEKALVAKVFVEAMHLIIRDKCDPMAVHRALVPMKEYQAGLSNDYPDSTYRGGW